MSVTTDNQKITLTWRTFLPIVAFLLVVSNTATGLIFKIDQNEINIKYDKARSDRKDKSQLDEVKQLLYISELEATIHELKLHQCDE